MWPTDIPHIQLALSPKDPSVRVHQSMLWDMSWRLGACGGFHLIHPLVHFAAHSWYCGTQFRLLLGWCFQVFSLALCFPPRPRAHARTQFWHSSHSTPSTMWVLTTTFFQSPPPPMMKSFPQFAVSTLAPSTYIRVLLQCQMPIFPLTATPNPISACMSVGPSLTEALDRRLRSVQWQLKVTFLWMSDTFPPTNLSWTQSSIWLPTIYL
jgi:hypothetical protein